MNLKAENEKDNYCPKMNFPHQRITKKGFHYISPSVYSGKQTELRKENDEILENMKNLIIKNSLLKPILWWRKGPLFLATHQLLFIILHAKKCIQSPVLQTAIWGKAEDQKAFNTEVQTYSVFCSLCQVWPKCPAMSESYWSQPKINLNYPLLFSEWKWS